MKTIVLNPFTLDAQEHSASNAIQFNDPSLTVQADVEQSDINYIVRQFGITHELPYGSAQAFYADVTDFPTDYQTAENFIIAAQEGFNTLPSQHRERFDNHAGKFLDFISDNANYDEAVKLGYIPPKDSPTTSADGFPAPINGESPPTAPPGVNDAAHSST